MMLYLYYRMARGTMDENSDDRAAGWTGPSLKDRSAAAYYFLLLALLFML